MSGEEEEPDYMSDKFLAGCLPKEKDVRPGLKRTHRNIREHELAKKKENFRLEKKQKPNLKELEIQNREEGLKKELDKTNKGFAMLQKLGYKVGEGLGPRSGARSGARTEPVPIVIKSGRGGLGRESVLQALKEQKSEMREKWKLRRSDSVSTDDYRKHLSEKNKRNKVEGDLRKCQKICEQLDLVKSFDKPPEPWFWPTKSKEKLLTDDYDIEEEEDENEEEEESEEFKPEEQLLMLTTYLRTQHLYCVWCVTSFNDLDDLEKSCPGNSRDDHDDED